MLTAALVNGDPGLVFYDEAEGSVGRRVEIAEGGVVAVGSALNPGKLAQVRRGS